MSDDEENIDVEEVEEEEADEITDLSNRYVLFRFSHFPCLLSPIFVH